MSLTVGQLRKLLKGVDNDVIVIMSKDGEGNGFSPLSEVDKENSVYEADSTWSGEVYDKNDGDYDEDDDVVPAVVLWPTN